MRIVRLYSILLYTEHMNEWFVFLKMDSIIVLLTIRFIRIAVFLFILMIGSGIRIELPIH